MGEAHIPSPVLVAPHAFSLILTAASQVALFLFYRRENYFQSLNKPAKAEKLGCGWIQDLRSSQPYLQPAKLFCPWNSPGKNTGVSCHFFLQGSQVTHCLKMLFPSDLVLPKVKLAMSSKPFNLRET